MTNSRPTARARFVAVLAKEILARPDTKPFMIESEHELRRRFGISRITVRLVLSDLENQGLIYREHGRGTFAYGKSDMVTFEISMTPGDWKKLDDLRGKKSRGEWVAERLKTARLKD